MKTLITLLFTLICSVNIAQNTAPKNELGLNVYGNLLSNNYLRNYYISGFQYKRKINDSYNFRSTFFINYYTNNFDTRPNPFWSYGQESDLLVEARVGIEKLFLKNKIRPFILSDIGYLYNNNKVTGEGNGDFPPYNYKINRDDKGNYLGINFGAGIKYFPTKHLYVSAETSLGFYSAIFKGSTNNNLGLILNPIKTLTFGVRF